MNRKALLNKTRRLVNEVTARLWSDADVYTEINNAYIEAQAAISRIAPAEFLRGAQIDTVAGTNLYERPTYEPLKVVRLKDSTTGSYRDLSKMDVDQLQDHASGATGRSATRFEPAYGLIGRWIVIRPTPETSVTAGLAVLYYEKLSLSADADTPRLPAALHHRIAYRAAELLLKDSKDVSNEALGQLQAEWAYYFVGEEALRRLAREHYYDHQPQTFTPSIAYSE